MAWGQTTHTTLGAGFGGTYGCDVFVKFACTDATTNFTQGRMSITPDDELH